MCQRVLFERAPKKSVQVEVRNSSHAVSHAHRVRHCALSLHVCITKNKTHGCAMAWKFHSFRKAHLVNCEPSACRCSHSCSRIQIMFWRSKCNLYTVLCTKMPGHFSDAFAHRITRRNDLMIERMTKMFETSKARLACETTHLCNEDRVVLLQQISLLHFHLTSR